MTAKIKPSRLFGRVTAPPSKSMAHRYIICASLADGKSVVENIEYSEDISATLDCVTALGARVERHERSVVIYGTDVRRTVPSGVLCARESGSTLRFMIPLALLSGNGTELCGSEKLFLRPLGVYESIAREKGLVFDKQGSHLFVCGELKSGEYVISDSKSSQFISGLLFALPLCDGDSKIILEGSLESRPYVEMTLFAMKEMGVKAYFEGDDRIVIPGGQTYRPSSVTVEGDYSNAAFFDALNLVGSSVVVDGLCDDTLQGDAVYREYYEKIKKGNAVLDVSDCPDLAPVLMALLADNGGGRLTGTRRLKYKESDRGEVMRRELSKLGAKITCLENEIIVENTKLFAPNKAIDSSLDHRVVMSLAVLLTRYGGEIKGCEDCRKSMPDFFERLKALGADITIMGEDS